MDEYNIHFRDIDLNLESINKDMTTIEKRFEDNEEALHSLEDDIFEIQ